ncbi:hypothetical protein, partial [Microvirga aerophila]|uniref:hypothetical protein n=1 Tax=Microvirga aerophila TaxID=670291 RepID=UPI001AED8A3F
TDMAHWNLDFLFDVALGSRRPEDEEPPAFLKANPGGSAPLLREEAFDLAQAAPFPLDETGEGGGEEKTATDGHETRGMNGLEEGFLGIRRRTGRATQNPAIWFPLSRQPLHETSPSR